MENSIEVEALNWSKVKPHSNSKRMQIFDK